MENPRFYANLVSEYCGHVFPVKPYDCEEKQMRHVQIHAAVQSANMLRKDALGAIGWCAFDYNTHGDYGSGDAYLADMQVKADDLTLTNTLVDTTRFVCRFVDQCGNLLPFCNGIVQIEVGEGLEVIGPGIVSALKTNIPEKTFTIHLQPQEIAIL